MLPPELPPKSSPKSFGTTETPTLVTVLEEIRGIKNQLAGLPTLLADIKSIKQEIADLKASSEFNSANIRDHADKIVTIESEVYNLKAIPDALQATRNELERVRLELEAKERSSRLNNVEVKGVPTRKTENLFEIADCIGKAVGYTFPKSQINYISRVPMRDSNEKLIIMSFNNRYVKEDFVAAARASKSLSTSCIPGLQGANHRIFVNDHLTPGHKNLLTQVKKLAKEKQFQYVWVKYGKIHVRKDDTSNVFIVAKDSDLNKII